MTQDNNINIKLEVFKDKFSGKISIIAHFIHSAPNVYKEKEDYVWFPTTEEKTFLLEAFDLTSKNSNYTYQDKTTPQPELKQEIKSTVVTGPTSGMEPKINIQHTEPHYSKGETVVLEQQKDTETSNFENYKQTSQSYSTPKIEEIKKEEQSTSNYFPKTQPKEKVPTVFDVPTNIKTYETKKDIKLPESYYKPNQEEIKKQEPYIHTYNDKKDLDDAVISQTEIEAIDAALKKHSEKDDYMVQADEKTIIDKVLNQKKKGKWNKT